MMTARLVLVSDQKLFGAAETSVARMLAKNRTSNRVRIVFIILQTQPAACAEAKRFRLNERNSREDDAAIAYSANRSGLGSALLRLSSGAVKAPYFDGV